MSRATFYKWRTKYGGMDSSMIFRLQELSSSLPQLPGVNYSTNTKGTNVVRK